MKRYINIYFCLLRLNFSALFSHRATLVNHVISSILWGVFPMISMYLLTARTHSIYGWNKAELFVLTGYFIFVLGLFYMIFGKSFKRFSTLMDSQSFDGTLLKPVDSQFLISFWHTNFTSSFRVIFGFIFFSYSLNYLAIELNTVTIIKLLLMTISGLTVLYALWFIFITTSFWFAKAIDIRQFLLTVNSIVRFPPEVTLNLPFFLSLLFLPLAYVIGVPTKIYLEKGNNTDIISLAFISVGLFLLSRLFWRFALRSYTSSNG